MSRKKGKCKCGLPKDHEGLCPPKCDRYPGRTDGDPKRISPVPKKKP